LPLPEPFKRKLEVWEDPEGLTSFIHSDKGGDGARKLLKPCSKLIKYIYASSHFDAMTLYYQFMDWGTYETDFEEDKLPYIK
jgi:hypothetical protein